MSVIANTADNGLPTRRCRRQKSREYSWTSSDCGRKDSVFVDLWFKRVPRPLGLCHRTFTNDYRRHARVLLPAAAPPVPRPAAATLAAPVRCSASHSSDAAIGHLILCVLCVSRPPQLSNLRAQYGAFDNPTLLTTLQSPRVVSGGRGDIQVYNPLGL